jgi:hypothetical protein
MIGIYLALLLLADDAAIRRAIATFNHTHERASVVARDARIPHFPDCWAQGESQMYFEVTAIRLVPDGAVAAANGNRYGSLILKRTTPAVFHLKREGADWKIDSLRIEDDCLGIISIRQ